MAVLDSSAIIHILEGTRQGLTIKEEYGDESTSTTAFSVNEVLIGLQGKRKEEAKAFINALEILPFDADAAFKSLDLENDLRAKGKLINKTDIFIASICVTYGTQIITTDADFENVHNLKVVLVR